MSHQLPSKMWRILSGVVLCFHTKAVANLTLADVFRGMMGSTVFLLGTAADVYNVTQTHLLVVLSSMP